MNPLAGLKPVDSYDLPASWDTFRNGDYETAASGVRTWKLAEDLERYRAIIEATKPEVIVETGTKFGGSAVWFASLGLDVITVDIDPDFSAGTRQANPGIHWIIGDTLDPAVLAAVTDLIDGRRAMVSLDSEHACPHVIREIQEYGKLVTPGCYLVVEDGIFDLVDPKYAHLGGARIPLEGGPLQALGVLAADPLWQRDAKIERMSARSHHPAGFWLRKAPKAPRAPKAAKGEAGALTAS